MTYVCGLHIESKYIHFGQVLFYLNKAYKTDFFKKIMKKEKPQIKKAAICFSGLVKHFEICYPYIKRNFLDKIEDYDVFCCAEDDSDIKKIEVMSPLKVKKIKSSEVDKIIKGKIKRLNKLNYKAFVLPQSRRFNFRNIYQQLYKIKGAFDLLKDYMKKSNVDYEYFVRIRFDFLPIDCIDIKEFKIAKNEIVTPKIKNLDPKNQINDMFCITRDFETFETYCSVINHYEEVSKKYVSLKADFPKRLYLSFEKKYNSFFISLLKEKGKISKNLLGFVLLFTKGKYFKFKERSRCSLEKVLFYYLKSRGKKIHYLPINFIIVRNPMDGLLIFG